MKVEFAFFRKGVSRAEYGLTFEMPCVPQTGDKIVVRRPDTTEIHPKETFIVKRTEWSLKSPIPQDPLISRAGTVGTVDLITVECEFRS
jgi:hypothetical protein